MAEHARPQNVNDCKRIMGNVLELTMTREIIVARAEKQVSEIVENAEREAARVDAALTPIVESILGFVQENRELFSGSNGRAITVDSGSFGNRKGGGVVVKDRARLLDFIFEQGYQDCIQVSQKINMDAIKKRILDHHETIPGVALEGAEEPFCTPSQTRIQEGIRNAI